MNFMHNTIYNLYDTFHIIVILSGYCDLLVDADELGDLIDVEL